MSPLSSAGGSSSPTESFWGLRTDAKHASSPLPGVAADKPAQCSLTAVSSRLDTTLPRCRRCSASSSNTSSTRVSGEDWCSLKHHTLGSYKKSTCCRHAAHLLRLRHTAARSGGRKHSCGVPDSSCATARRRLRSLAHRCCDSLYLEHSSEHEPEDAHVFTWSPQLVLEYLRSSLSLLLRGSMLRNNATDHRSLVPQEMETSQPRVATDCDVLRASVPVPSSPVVPAAEDLESCTPDVLRRDSSHNKRRYTENISRDSQHRDDRVLESFRNDAKGPIAPDCIYSSILNFNSKKSEYHNSRSVEHNSRRSERTTRSCERKFMNTEVLSENNTENNFSVPKQRSVPLALPNSLPSTNISVFPKGKKSSCDALRWLSRPWGNVHWSPVWTVFLSLLLFFLCASLPDVAEGCSSRSTPRPRPQNTTLRPNITFQTYACPPAYAAWYCLNGATCFTVKISESILYNCECADGYMGQRCEYKDLDGSYLPAGGKVLLETASIAGGAALIILLVFFGIFSVYVLKNKQDDRELDGVPRINININNSWPGSPEGNTPTRYYEHHTITTSTPSHHEISPESPHNTNQSHPIYHCSPQPSTPPFSSHSLVSVSGKTLSSDMDGAKDWGQPDRVVKTVTTITDLASIYSGRQQAVHRVEVVQEIDLVAGDKVPLTSHLSCIGAPSWGNPGSLAKSPWTAAPLWPQFKASSLLNFNQKAEDQLKILPSKDSESCDVHKVVTKISNENSLLPALLSPVEGDASDLSSQQCREGMEDPGSVSDICCPPLQGPEYRPDILPITPAAAARFTIESPRLLPSASVHLSRNNSSSLNDGSNSSFCQKPTFTQISSLRCNTSSPSFNSSPSLSFNPISSPSFYHTSSPSYNPTSSPNFNPTSRPSYNSTSPSFTPTCSPSFTPTCSPSFNPTSSPIYNSTASPSFNPASNPSFNVNAGMCNAAFTPDNV